MKYTYVKSWKGEKLDSEAVIYGPTLTTNGFGSYGISHLSIVEVCLGHLQGITVKKESIFWECNNCEQFNHYKQIVCSKCGQTLAGRDK